MTWAVNNFTSNEIEIKLDFEKALQISADSDYDSLQVSFNSSSMFFSKSGKPLNSKFVNLVKKIPKQSKK